MICDSFWVTLDKNDDHIIKPATNKISKQSVGIHFDSNMHALRHSANWKNNYPYYLKKHAVGVTWYGFRKGKECSRFTFKKFAQLARTSTEDVMVTKVLKTAATVSIVTLTFRQCCTLFDIQSSAFITRSNIVRYCINS